MELIKKKGLIIYWILLVIECYLIFDEPIKQIHWIRFALMPLLAIYFFSNVRKNQNSTYKLYLFFAFISAWVGDALAAFDNALLLVPTIACTTAMHVFYSLSLYKIKPLKIEMSQEAFFALVTAAVGCYVLYKFIYVNLGNYKIPVVIVMVVISTTFVLACNIYSSTARRLLAIAHFMPGAFLLGLSAACIAVNKFFFNEPYLDVVTLLTYGYAQSLIIDGFSKMLK